MTSECSLLKAALRRQIIAAREALPPADRAAASAAICARVTALECWRAARTLMLFASFGAEVDTRPLITAALREGRRLVLPRVNRERRALDLFRITDPATDLAPGVWGIPEPQPDRCAPAAIADLDCLILPGVAFDRQGGRLGYGGGFYDRILEALSPTQRAATIAVAFELQLVTQVPCEPHDLTVAHLCTERETYRCAPSGQSPAISR